MSLVKGKTLPGDFAQAGKPTVFGRDDRVGDGPANAKGGIGPENPAFILRIIRLRASVDDIGRVTESTESVGEAFGNEELAPILLGELDPGPPAEGGRTMADVHGDIENLSAYDLDQLRLGTAELVVKASQGPPNRMRVVYLDDRRPETRPSIALLMVDLHQEAAVVCEEIRLDEPNIGQGCG